MKRQLLLSAAAGLAGVVILPGIAAQDRPRPKIDIDKAQPALKKIEDAVGGLLGPKDKPKGDAKDEPKDIPPADKPKDDLDNAAVTPDLPAPGGISTPEKEPDTLKNVEKNDDPLEMADQVIPEYIDSQILYFSDAIEPRLKQIAAAVGITVIEVTDLDQIGISMITAKLNPADDIKDIIHSLEQENGVIWAQPNHYFQLLGGNSRSRGLALHSLTKDEQSFQSATIVQIDSMVDVKNPDLSGANIEQRLFGAVGTPDAHGTAIAELLVGTGNYGGVARDAKLISLAAFEPTKKKTWLSQTRYLAKALNEALRIRPNVANLSFGANSSDRILSLLLKKMESQGICVVSAAGNGNGGKVLFPARLKSTLAVTAIDARKRAYKYASIGPEINTAAWGVNMSAAVPGGRRSVSGTSFATAIVSGSLLRLPACNGEWNPAMMRELVARYAADLGAPGHDDIFGAGLFQLDEDNAKISRNDRPKKARKNIETSFFEGQIVQVIIGISAIAAGLLLLFAWRRRRRKAG